MNRPATFLLVGAGALGLALGGYGVASAATGATRQATPTEVADDDTGGTDTDAPLTGTDLDKAVAAALEHTGEGEVTETEVGDDGAAFGVEIKLNDGSQVEVNLDADFNVIGTEADDD